MARLPHGAPVTVEMIQGARADLAAAAGDVALAFAAAMPADLQDFDFMFPDLQNDPGSLLDEGPGSDMPAKLVQLGLSMRDTRDEPGRPPSEPPGDSGIPAIYTYFGQFVDHDITLETLSAPLPALFDPNLRPLPAATIRTILRNSRTATLDLDSVYGFPAPVNGAKMEVGKVTELDESQPFSRRPPGKDDDNDLPRLARSTVPDHDRAALIGDPRNDENTIVSQLHLAFLRAHNALVDQGHTFDEARRLLRQHYQHIVLHDFLKRIADPQIVDRIITYGNQVYDGLAEPFFMPLEFSVGAYRFGHSMVRANYDFNINFNESGTLDTIPASLGLLFTFTALSGGLGFGQGNDTLPENWIVEWENFVDGGASVARRIDTMLVEPLFHLPNLAGVELPGNEARLAVRNLLRGYLLRLPTGQAVANALGIPPLTPAEIEAVAQAADAAFTGDPAEQVKQHDALIAGSFHQRTPLWYYILAEAAHHGGQRLGPVGSTLVAEVLVGLVRRSEDSILRTKGWAPSLPSAQPGDFKLADLLALAGVLTSQAAPVIAPVVVPAGD